MKRLLLPVMAGLLTFVVGCASTPDAQPDSAADDSASEASPASRSARQQKAAPEKPQAPAAKPPSTPQTSVSFATTTLANEETFAGQIPQPRLEEVLTELEQMYRERSDDGGALISYLVFRRLSGTSRDFLGVLERRGSTASSRDPWILIECAYTALLRRDYGMALYLLDTAQTVGKGKDKVAAAVIHARGVMFYKQKKTVLAMDAFRTAANQNYEPAILTLTFFSLKAGDHEGALTQINKLKDSASGNLNVKAALGIAYRLAGKPEEALEYLKAVQRARPNDRRTLWNLALATSQIPARRKEAISLLEKYNEAPGSNPEFDTRARNLLSRLQNLEEAARAEESKPKPAAGSAGDQANPPASEKSDAQSQ